VGGDHGHAHGHTHASAGARYRRRLALAFALTLAYGLVELVAGLLTGSLALLSDSAHMGTDVLGLGMALAAITLASRPAASHRTWGAYRLEVLAALANGVLLFGVAGYVLVEAWLRFTGPPEVSGAPLLLVAVAGVWVNLISLRLLRPGATESLNVRGAYLEVFADLLGSIGVVVAGVVLLTTGWAYVDPIVGAAIGLFILPRTWQLMGQAVRILMEAAPRGLDVDDVRKRIRGLDGVADVHDLHIWTVTSGLDTASGHVVVDSGADYHGVLDRVTSLLAEDYGVTHATIQCEPDDHTEHTNPV
jgi:cobalt-zinc-cadmium efflux system protein